MIKSFEQKSNHQYRRAIFSLEIIGLVFKPAAQVKDWQARHSEIDERHLAALHITLELSGTSSTCASILQGLAALSVMTQVTWKHPCCTPKSVCEAARA